MNILSLVSYCKDMLDCARNVRPHATLYNPRDKCCNILRILTVAVFEFLSERLVRGRHLQCHGPGVSSLVL